MSMRHRREGEKAEMKRCIMAAAIEIINGQGYEKVSMRKIAAKIGYSPTTIYLYYRDKGQIIADMAAQLYEKTQRRAQMAADEARFMPLKEQLGRVLLAFVFCLSEEPEMVRAIVHSGLNVIYANEGPHPTPSNEGIAMLDALLNEGIDQGLFRPEARNASWMIVSALLGFVISAVENQLHLLDDYARLSESFVGLLMGGILI